MILALAVVVYGLFQRPVRVEDSRTPSGNRALP
jgi:hypothetical protein